MDVSKGVASGALLGWASRLRFPTLFVITLIVFVGDLFVPDFIPFADELILGLGTLLFGTLKKRVGKDSSEKGQ